MSWYHFGLVFSLCHAIANNFSSPFSPINKGKGLNYFCMNLRKEKKNSGMAEDGEGKKRRKMEKENKNEGIIHVVDLICLSSMTRVYKARVATVNSSLLYLSC